MVATLTWLALAVHVIVGILVWRRVTSVPLLPWLNLVMALGVLSYWIPRWISYVTRGIIWYATDQLVPLFALVVVVLAAFSLTGRMHTMVPHWVIYAIHFAVSIAAVVFVSTFRITRLI